MSFRLGQSVNNNLWSLLQPDESMLTAQTTNKPSIRASTYHTYVSHACLKDYVKEFFSILFFCLKIKQDDIQVGTKEVRIF
jgi:hypothetical protein